MALAHTIKDKSEAAYRRGDAIDKRRRLMDEWATLLRSAFRDGRKRCGDQRLIGPVDNFLRGMPEMTLHGCRKCVV